MLRTYILTIISVSQFIYPTLTNPTARRAWSIFLLCGSCALGLKTTICHILGIRYVRYVFCSLVLTTS